MACVDAAIIHPVEHPVDEESVYINNPRILIFVNYECRLLCNNSRIFELKENLQHEVERLKDFFKSCKFYVDEKDIHEDIRKSDVTGEEDTFDVLVNECARDPHLTNNDSLIVCLLGISGNRDLMCLHDDKVTLDEVVNPFKGDRCVYLLGKPKLFFVQVYSGIEEAWRAQAGVPENRVPIDADIFVAYANLPYDWRGQTMMSSMSKAWSAGPRPELCEMFSIVNETVNAISTEEDVCDNIMPKPTLSKPILCIMSTLTAFVYLRIQKKTSDDSPDLNSVTDDLF